MKQVGDEQDRATSGIGRAPRTTPLLASVLKASLLAAGLVAAGVAVRILAPDLVAGAGGAGPGTATGGAGALLAHRFAGAGPAGVAEFLLLGAIVCAVGLPRQAVCFAAGLAWGAVAGSAVGLAATLIGCLADFAWARIVARDWARRRVLARSNRLAGLDRAVEARPFASILTLRLLPVGSSLLLSLAAGLSRAPLGAFLAATLLGALPQTVVFALLGSGVGVGHVARIALAVALFAASAALGAVLMRKRDTPLEIAEAG